MNFEILYSEQYDNPSIISQTLNKNSLYKNGSLHQISNISSVEKINIRLERLFYIIKQNPLCPRKAMGGRAL